MMVVCTLYATIVVPHAVFNIVFKCVFSGCIAYIYIFFNGQQPKSLLTAVFNGYDKAKMKPKQLSSNTFLICCTTVL